VKDSECKRLMKVRDAVEEYGFDNEQELYREIREGLIPPGPVLHLGRRVYINREAFEEWIAAG
jgi:hypothetical protein